MSVNCFGRVGGPGEMLRRSVSEALDFGRDEAGSTPLCPRGHFILLKSAFMSASMEFSSSL